ncbi:hypothetical protein ES703_30393 [subsurface metagenome]
MAGFILLGSDDPVLELKLIGGYVRRVAGLNYWDKIIHIFSDILKDDAEIA